LSGKGTAPTAGVSAGCAGLRRHGPGWFAAVAVLGLALGGAPAGASEKKVEEYLQAFWTSALWQDPGTTGANTSPVGLSKFPEGTKLRIAVGGSMGDSYRDRVASQIGSFLGAARIEYEILPAGEDSAANVALKFISFQPSTTIPNAICVTRTTPRLGALRNATLEIHDRAVSRCLAHEMLHVIGFVGHPHDSNSVLSYIYNNTDFTEIDRMMARVLYDRRLRPNMRHVEAIAAARDVLVDLMVADGAPPETRDMGRRFVANVPAALEKLIAENRSNKFAQGDARFQLALAYTLGHVVAKDEAKGYGLFVGAAELFPKWSEPQFYIGYALHNGRGTAINEAEGIAWYRKAAEAGHSTAQNNLGNALWHGRGVEKDLVEAYKWFELAANQGQSNAQRNRESLRKEIGDANMQEAVGRAKAWKPAP
jgi:hypothetical protein